jgi:hypothetical protein
MALACSRAKPLLIGVGAHARRLGKKLRHLGHGVFRGQRQVRDQDVHRFSALVLEHLFQRGLRRLLASSGRRIQVGEAAFELGEEAVVDVEEQSVIRLMDSVAPSAALVTAGNILAPSIRWVMRLW